MGREVGWGTGFIVDMWGVVLCLLNGMVLSVEWSWENGMFLVGGICVYAYT